MADYHERRRLIRESLKIQPLSHGQVYTYTVGVRSQPEISPDRYEELRWSLENHSSNLIPIVVRRTDSLGDEKEYEAIYGADWVRVAEDIGIEMLWAWVFDLSDEDVKATQAELAMLLESASGTTISPPPNAAEPEEFPAQPSSTPQPVVSGSDLMLETLARSLSSTLDQTLDQKLEQALARLSYLAGARENDGGAIASLEHKLDHLERRLNHLTDAISNLAHSVESLKQRPAASRSMNSRSAKKTIDLNEIYAKLKQFRQDPSSIPADQLRDELSQMKVVKDQLSAWADELGLGKIVPKNPHKIKKSQLIDILLAI
jgi:hypothetical protein